MENTQKLQKAAGYDEIAREVFLPVFPVIAKEALEIYGRNDGICLDIGCGGGLFGYFVGLLSDMELMFMDKEPGAIEICRKRGIEWGLDDRCRYAVSDVHDMSIIPDGSIDLAVSRGSIPFWGEGEEFVQAFREIYRIIAPRGAAVIGGSLGPSRMCAAIKAKMKERNPDWTPSGSGSGGCVSGYDEKQRILEKAGIKCEARVTDRGHWIVIKK